MKKTMVIIMILATFMIGCSAPDKTPEAAKVIAQDMLSAISSYDKEKLLSHISDDIKNKVDSGVLHLGSSGIGHYEVIDSKVEGDNAKVKIKLIVDPKKSMKSLEKYEPLTVWIFRINGGEWKLIATDQESQI